MDALLALQKRLRLVSEARVRAGEVADPELRAVLARGRPRAGRGSESAVLAPRAAPAGTIVARRDLTPSLAIFRIAKPPSFRFEPGQHVRIEVAGQSRPYSIVSAPHEPFLELFVERAPRGAFTPGLFALREGDRVEVAERAKGSLRLERVRPNLLAVATVTGVAPFVSMVRSLSRGRTPWPVRFHLLHGASHADELGYADELARLPMTYVPTVSRPSDPRNAGWRGAVGRVHTLVDAHLRRHALSPADTVVLACGHPGMVDSVRAALGPRGYRVRTERYFK